MCTPKSVSHILLVLVFVGRTVTQTVPALSLSLSLPLSFFSHSFIFFRLLFGGFDVLCAALW